MIDIFYFINDSPIAEKQWLEYLDSLTDDLRIKASSYLRWQDRQAYVLGRILLLLGLTKYGFDNNILSKIQYTKYGRPFLNQEIDFNISHCDGYVVCALGEGVRLGVDIEVIKDINFEDFNNVMTESQWCQITSSQNPIKSFFSLWTVKESVIKADGKGLSIPILDINPSVNNKVEYKNETWYLKEFCLNNDTCASLASNVPEVDLHFTQIDFHGLVRWDKY